MAKLIGTCGHVDHGKTTLIHALTGIDADRFPEEKLRGMTIDIGFAYVDLPVHGRVSIVDVPGHERFLSNMLVGAMGVDVGLLCIAADAGVMPQTREHLAILDLLPVTRIVIALTRSDLAEPELQELLKLEIADLLGSTRFRDVPMVAVSAITKEGLDELRQVLDDALSAPQPSRSGPWYLPIDRAFTVKGHGTVVTGTVMQGSVKEGSPAVIMPSGTTTRVRSVQSHDESMQEREFGNRTALNLAGVDLDEVHRGMSVGEPGVLFATSCLDLTIRWVTEPKHGQRIRLSIGADEVMGKVFLNDNDPTFAQVRLERDTAAASGQPIILRRYSPPDLLGGGKVAVPQALAKRRTAAVMKIAEGDDRTKVIGATESYPNGVTSEAICRILGRTNQQIGGIFETLKDEGVLLGFAGTWFTPSSFEVAATKLLDALLLCHAEQTNRSGVPRERAVAKAGLPWAGKPLDRIVAHLAAEGRLRMAGTEIAHPDFIVRLNPRQEELLRRVEEELERQGFSVPTPRDLGPILGIPSQAVDQILEIGLHSHRLVRLTPEIFYTVWQMEKLKSEARRFNRPFTAGEFRDHLSASRKYVIPILERWDAERFTTRQGDARIVNE